MKKKFSAFDIIGLGVISYLICIIFGLVSKHVFNLGDVDILSSSATLFAGIVAAYLYSDWREPYLLNKIDQEQKDLRNALKTYRVNYNNFLQFINIENKGKKLNNDDIASLKYKKLLNLLLDDLEEISNLLNKYIINFGESTPTESEHKNNLQSHLSDVSKLIETLTKYDWHKDYLKSYKHVLDDIASTSFTTTGSKIGFSLVETLTKSYEVLK